MSDDLALRALAEVLGERLRPSIEPTSLIYGQAAEIIAALDKKGVSLAVRPKIEGGR